MESPGGRNAVRASERVIEKRAGGKIERETDINKHGSAAFRLSKEIYIYHSLKPKGEEKNPVNDLQMVRG